MSSNKHLQLKLPMQRNLVTLDKKNKLHKKLALYSNKREEKVNHSCWPAHKTKKYTCKLRVIGDKRELHEMEVKQSKSDNLKKQLSIMHGDKATKKKNPDLVMFNGINLFKELKEALRVLINRKRLRLLNLVKLNIKPKEMRIIKKLNQLSKIIRFKILEIIWICPQIQPKNSIKMHKKKQIYTNQKIWDIKNQFN